MVDIEPSATSEEQVRALLDFADGLKQAWAAVRGRLAGARRVHFMAFGAGASLAIAGVLCAVAYVHYSRLIDRRLRSGAFPDSVNIYAAPLKLSAGDTVELRDVIAQLPAGSWRLRNGWMEIPGARVLIANGQVAHILIDGKEVRDVSLAAPLITTLSGTKEKRLLTTFREIPPVVVQAIVSTEDKRFFQHGGLDLARVIKAAYVDFKNGRKDQGASTLTMQLVRALSLEPDKRWKRKLAETMMTIHLEHEWSKEKIFETYVNQVYFGRQADYSVHGFGQAARMFFGKELRDVSLPEAALLAGLVQRPSYFNPV